ncbi:hypothetical protein ACWDBD_49500 [Streptomyces sp. NPDC001118]
MPSPFARYAPVATRIRFAQVEKFDAATFTEEEVALVLVDMTIAETDEWEWITETLVPTGRETRGIKVYLQDTGELLGIMLSVGSGWHVEHYDTTMGHPEFFAVPFPGPRRTARTEGMALQQMYNARTSALRLARIEAERHRQERQERQERQAAEEAQRGSLAYWPGTRAA